MLGCAGRDGVDNVVLGCCVEKLFVRSEFVINLVAWSAVTAFTTTSCRDETLVQ